MIAVKTGYNFPMTGMLDAIGNTPIVELRSTDLYAHPIGRDMQG